jgi:hypothetical protein
VAIQIKKDGIESGKAAYRVTATRLGGPMFVALIRYFDKEALANAGNQDEAPHWALMHWTGRIDRFDTLAEAKAEARKTYA